MSIYEELEKRRQAHYEIYQKNASKARIFFIIAGICIVIFIVGAINSGPEVPILSLLSMFVMMIMFVAGSVFLTKAQRSSKAFTREVKNEFVAKILNDNFDNPGFNEHSHVAISKINSVGLVKAPDRYSGEDLITGTYKNVSFEVSDIELKERHETRTKNGTQVTYVTYFKGRWYVYKFPKNFNQTLKIVEKSFGTTTRGLKKYETEMLEFNKKFSIFASDQQFFFYLIDPFLIERLLLLEQAHKGSIYYCVKNNELHIGVNDGSDSLRINIKQPINEKTLERFTEDIVLIKTIVDEFRLDSIKFK